MMRPLAKDLSINPRIISISFILGLLTFSQKGLLHLVEVKLAAGGVCGIFLAVKSKISSPKL